MNWYDRLRPWQRTAILGGCLGTSVAASLFGLGSLIWFLVS